MEGYYAVDITSKGNLYSKTNMLKDVDACMYFEG